MRRGLFTRSRRNEVDAAGCLVLMGGLVFLPVLLYGLGTIVVLVRDVFVSVQTAGWSEIPRWLWVAWQWLLGRSSSGASSPLLALFVTCFVILLLQWTAFVFDWHPRISSSRLWAISSGYFLVTMVAFAFSKLLVSTSNFGSWLAVTLAFCVGTGAFLCVTVSLWMMSSRSRGKTANHKNSKQTLT